MWMGTLQHFVLLNLNLNTVLAYASLLSIYLAAILVCPQTRLQYWPDPINIQLPPPAFNFSTSLFQPNKPNQKVWKKHQTIHSNNADFTELVFPRRIWKVWLGLALVLLMVPLRCEVLLMCLYNSSLFRNAAHLETMVTSCGGSRIKATLESSTACIVWNVSVSHGAHHREGSFLP